MNKSTKDFAYKPGYSELVKASGLAEHAPVRGCMTIKPYGFALWENMRSILDKALKEQGHVNAYFPLLIPASYLTKEASHITGFAKESAVVTHYRVKYDDQNKTIVPDPHAQLQDPLIIRPTSEAIIWPSYKNWIQSYRDLPLRVNQWANVLRWEMRPRLFLRTVEMLWQEVHTAHATVREASEEALNMLHIYTAFIEQTLAIPIVQGEKTPHERFAGAEKTYTMEALMQDGKALQVGTSHFLAQNFPKAFRVQFVDKNGKLKSPSATSAGVTTRLIGAMIMTHSDSKGLILPPKVAPIQIVIIPIVKKQKEDNTPITQQSNILYKKLEQKGIAAKIDDRDTHRPGWKFAEHELKGIPLRAVVGAREVVEQTVTFVRRDTQEKVVVSMDNFLDVAESLLSKIQTTLYTKALAFRKENTTYVDDYQTFKKVMKSQQGFVMAHWDGTTATEKKIHEETQATIRCIPLHAPAENSVCIYSGKPSTRRVLFAQAY